MSSPLLHVPYSGNNRLDACSAGSVQFYPKLHGQQADDQDPLDDIADDLSEDGGVIAVLRAYFDASRRESGLFTVAGYMIDSGQARRFRQEWNPIFAKYGGLHMTDLVALQERFKGITRAESNDLIKRAVPIIRERIICGVAVSCWTQDVENHSPRWIRGFGHPYAICCHIAMTALGIWAHDHDYRSGITYVFEAGDAYSPEAHHMMSIAATHPIVQESYQYRGHMFVPKGEQLAAPLQAADFFAWEWGKWFDESLAQRKRPMRMSLVHLLYDQLHRYSFQPMHGERFLRFLDQIRDLGLEELQERDDALRAAGVVDVQADLETAKDREE